MMDITKAKELLRTLADGIDPRTGELLPDDSICNQVEIVRAIHCVLDALSHNYNDGPQKGNKLKNAGKPWTEDDDAALNRMFDDRCTVKEMQDFFQRSKGAITARLVKLGKISERTESS